MYKKESISYAFREDPTTIIALEDGGDCFKNVYQVTAFRRKLIRPELIEAPLFFCENNYKYVGKPTDIMNQIFDDRIHLKYDYAVVVDSQVEFEIDYSVLNKLSKEYMPARDAATYQQYFSSYTSGVLVFCRVYKTNKAVNQNYLQKGKQGSAQIIKLYDEYDLETSVVIDDFVPVLSDNKFAYIKDEIIHLLKTENAFISLYQNNTKDNERLELRLESDKALKNISTQSRFVFDENLDMDMAQLDYDLIFNQVIRICPNMKSVIEHIRGIQAARYNESTYLFSQRDDAENWKYAKQRLFDMNVRTAVKSALYYYKKYGVYIEDAFQEACIGIIFAIDRYNESVQSLFPSYVSTWMNQTMKRNLPIYQYNVRLPAHYFEKLLSIAASVALNFGDDLSSWDLGTIKEWLQSCLEINEEEAKSICAILIHAYSVEDVIENNEEILSDKGDFIDSVDERLFLESINSTLCCLTEREKEIIKLRYGYDNYLGELTLNDVGKFYGVTRERIRQIEINSFRKIKRYIKKTKLYENMYRDFTSDELYPKSAKKRY